MSHARRELWTQWHSEAGCQLCHSLRLLSRSLPGVSAARGGGAFRGRQMLPYVFRNTCSSTFLPCLWLLTLQALYQTCEKSTEPALTLQD